MTAWALRMGFGLAVLLAAGLLWIWLRQERMLFYPSPLQADHRFDFGADVEEVQIPVAGAVLSGLHLRQGTPKGLVFYLHGNAGNLQSWFVTADFYRRAGYDLFMLDYRGYGKSSGKIESEAQLRADVRAAWDSIAPRYTGKRRVIVGRSLGTALAAELAVQVQPDELVLISPYVRMVELMRQHFPLLPTWLLRYPLDTAGSLKNWQGPLLLLHGARDEMIPASHSLQLQQLAPQSRLTLIPGANHSDLQEYDQYLQSVKQALP